MSAPLVEVTGFMRLAILFKKIHDLQEVGPEKAEALAAKLASLMRLSLRTNIFGLSHNKGLTIEAKGRNQPGYDTGQMMSAIKHTEIAKKDTREGTAVSYFIGIRNEESGDYPGPVSANFEDGQWADYYNPIPLVSIAYLFVHGQLVKMPPRASRLGDAPARDFVTPSYELMEPQIKEEFEYFTKKFLLSL